MMGSIAARLEYQHHCTVVGIVGAVGQAVEAITEHRPNIVLMDMDEAGADSGDRIGAMLTAQPDIRIVLMSATIDERRIEQALAVGVRGFLLKGSLTDEIAGAIQEVLAGGTFFAEEVRSRIVIGPSGIWLGRRSG
jgi:two-component system uhpT operon response regulator UhpA